MLRSAKASFKEALQNKMYGKSQKIRLVESTTERIARVIGEKYNIRVIFKHNTCETNGKIIYLPTIPNDAPDEILKAIPGLVDHETSHILFSNFDQFKLIEEYKDPQKLKSLANALEDARVESLMVQKYRGSTVNLKKCKDWANKKLLESWNNISGWGKVFRIAGAIADSLDSKISEDLKSLDPDLFKYVSQFEDDLKSAVSLGSTVEVIDLSKKILEKMDLDDPNQNKSKPSGEKESTIQKTLPKEYSDKDLEGDNNLTNLQIRVKDELKTVICNTNDPYLIFSTETDTIEKIVGTTQDKVELQKFLTKARIATNEVRTRLMRSLLSESKSRWEAGKERGRVNGRSLHRLVKGTSKRIFKQVSISEGMNTVASMWIDHSGSMITDDSITVAAETAIIFGEVLHRLSIPFEVCGFSTLSPNVGRQRFSSAQAELKNKFTRWGSLWIGQYKEFDDNWISQRHVLCRMPQSIMNNSFDGETLSIAAKRILARPEKRKIIFWLNDGEPYPNIKKFIKNHELFHRDVVKEVEKHVEVVAIGIKTDSVSNFFKDYVVVNSIEDLPKVTINQLNRLLNKNKKRAHIR